MKNVLKKSGLFLWKWTKKIVGAILWLVFFCCLSPWLATSIIGVICGSLFTSFMSGLATGTTAFRKIRLNLGFLNAVTEGEKLKTKEK